MSAQLNPNGYTAIVCYKCRVEFCITDDLYLARRRDRESFWCPNGHEQHFTGPSKEALRIQELEREVTLARQSRDRAIETRQWAETRAKGANIAAGKAKAAKRRLEQRVSHGVCPCCHRAFKQLAAHMKTKHPEMTR
jgi:hypothetical protein